MFRNVPKSNDTRVPRFNLSNMNGYRSSRSTGGGRGGRGGSGFNRREVVKRGLFADGIWLCDCTPRLPAEHFKVKKESKNQGRWFYTCQNSEGRRCGFFLWDEDAEPREKAAVLSGRRGEPTEAAKPSHSRVLEEGAQQMASQMSTQSQEAPPPYSYVADSMPTGSPATLGRSNASNNARNNKRSLTETEFEFDVDDEDAFPWDLTGREADELERRASRPPETPRKAIKTTAYATPATTGKRQLPWLDQTSERTPNPPETPSKSITLPTPSKSNTLPTPHRAGMITPRTSTTSTTPTPSRFHNPLATSSTSSSFTSEVFTLFNSGSAYLPQETANQVRSILDNHDLKYQGVVKGRDIVRLALKARDAKVAELNARIASLEAEREFDRARIRGLRLRDDMAD